ncbi:MAG: Rv3654c family TadE-like protein [Jatrophihabitantaceae bacterium]
MTGHHRGDHAVGDRGSATIWVCACAALLMVLSYAHVVRAEAVLGRHRAESAADLAALAAAGQIGVSADPCAAAARIAAANSATLNECRPSLAADGRVGAVRVRIALSVHLPILGERTVFASARAGRGVPP